MVILGCSQVERILKIATHALARRSDEPPLVHFEESGQTFKVGVGCTMVVCLCLARLGKSCGGIGQQRGSISAQVGRRNETGQEECCARQHHILLHSTCARCLDQRLEAAFPNLLLAFALLFFGSSPEQRCLKWNDTFLVRQISPFLILLFCSCFILYYTNITMKFAILASLIACAAAFTNVPAKTAVRF